MLDQGYKNPDPIQVQDQGCLIHGYSRTQPRTRWPSIIKDLKFVNIGTRLLTSRAATIMVKQHGERHLYRQDKWINDDGRIHRSM